MFSRLFIAALWSPAGKGISWLLFVMFIVFLLPSHVVYWFRCGTWLYHFLIFAVFLTLFLPIGMPHLERNYINYHQYCFFLENSSTHWNSRGKWSEVWFYLLTYAPHLQLNQEHCYQFCCLLKTYMSRNMRFPTMQYVRPAKAQTSLRIRAGWSEPLLVAHTALLEISCC